MKKRLPSIVIGDTIARRQVLSCLIEQKLGPGICGIKIAERNFPSQMFVASV